MRDRSFLRLVASASLTVIVAAGLGGCSSMSMSLKDVTGSTPSSSSPKPQSEAEWRKAAEYYGQRYRNNPKDADAGLRYGQALRATGQKTQAVAVLEQAAIGHPTNKALLAAYGRSLFDVGKFQQSFDTLGRAHTPDNPDWSILSVQGAALDQLGKHEQARGYYLSALKIAPEEPSVLSNLGMSYILTKDLPKAEDALRRAYASTRADARVRQNLALAVGLQGRFDEAETIARADLSPEEAASNVAYLKDMLGRDSNPPANSRARRNATASAAPRA